MRERQRKECEPSANSRTRSLGSDQPPFTGMVAKDTQVTEGMLAAGRFQRGNAGRNSDFPEHPDIALAMTCFRDVRSGSRNGLEEISLRLQAAAGCDPLIVFVQQVCGKLRLTSETGG